MENTFSKIILGTAQLGMPYGLGKWKHELMPEAVAFSILDRAWERGIRTIDTSPDYGIAEARLGKYLNNNPSKSFNVITKIKNLPTDVWELSNTFENWVRSCPFVSMENITNINLLLHDERHLYQTEIIDILNNLRRNGSITAWGVSAYHSKTLNKATEIDNCTVAEIPAGILNQTFISSDKLKKLAQLNKDILARSIYTQGLLFQDPNLVSHYSKELAKLLADLREFAQKSKVNLPSLGAGFVLAQPYLNNVIVGADDAEQLLQLDFSQELHLKGEKFLNLLARAREIDSSLVRPEKWKPKTIIEKLNGEL